MDMEAVNSLTVGTDVAECVSAIVTTSNKSQIEKESKKKSMIRGEGAKRGAITSRYYLVSSHKELLTCHMSARPSGSAVSDVIR